METGKTFGYKRPRESYFSYVLNKHLIGMLPDQNVFVGATKSCKPPIDALIIYLSMSSRAWAARVRGFRTWCLKFACRSGRERFHIVTHPA